MDDLLTIGIKRMEHFLHDKEYNVHNSYNNYRDDKIMRLKHLLKNNLLTYRQMKEG